MAGFLFPIKKLKISGHSMEPILKNGDIVLINRLAYVFSSPKKGDIIAAKINKKVFIKRITKIDNNKFFLCGDNQKDSLDSRKFGLISKKDIIGKVIS